jgi:glutamate--cysteine ligase
MAAADSEATRPVGDPGELVRGFHAAAKPRAAWRVGAEHEKIGVIVDPRRGAVGSAPAYDWPSGIAAVLAGLGAYGWANVEEHGKVIALSRDGASVSLEPGGQFELSGAPHARLADNVAESQRHLAEVRAVAQNLGLAWLAVGFRPFGTLADVPWMPKGRYAVMRAYLPTRGSRGLEMMKRTATVQANLDFADEDDAERKFRTAMSVTSIVTAIYANSPIVDGRDSGFQSYRAHVWLDTDNDRCGMPAFSFERGGFFRRYAEWALDVPMFFVHRERFGGYRPADGLTFRRFMRDGFDGEHATMADWTLHLSTLFPETRLKSYLEMRGADAGTVPMVEALPALWKGLLHHDDARAAAEAITAHLGVEERLALRAEVPRAGLGAAVPAARGGTTTVLAWARELVAIAKAGLAQIEPEAVPSLAPLEEVVTSGRSPADHVREVWRALGGDPARVCAALAL